MSQITENTLIIKKSDEHNFEKDYDRYEDDYRLNHIQQVFDGRMDDGEEICIYVLDCNGDLPWELESDCLCQPIAMETYYFDDNELWTRLKGSDSDYSLKEYVIKNLTLSDEEMNNLLDKISYSSDYVASHEVTEIDER
jgi:hypothetical protein